MEFVWGTTIHDLEFIHRHRRLVQQSHYGFFSAFEAIRRGIPLIEAIRQVIFPHCSIEAGL